ncbi:MAG: FAD-dependent oxidoreductase [Acidobacteria bacterium]|nr:FAD-dependent oxidoreductase [Acidobacteriota bacterium]
MNRRTFLLSSAMGAGGLLFTPTVNSAEQGPSDVIVYGGTASGVAAAVAAARQGARVTLLEPGTHLGGMVSGGLGHTDHGNIKTIGGISLEFFQRVGRHYGQPTTWNFEPHVAESVFKRMAAEAKVDVLYRHRLKEHGGVRKRGLHITEVVTENGRAFPARVFIDATYGGDLLAQAGASFTWGRESREQYNESFAGVRAADKYAHHRFDVPVSAYNAQGKLLPNIYPGPRGKIGAGDKKVQAYNFRLCLTRERDNQVPIPEPSHYDPKQYALLARLIAADIKKNRRPPTMHQFMIISPLPNGKTDINNKGAFSTDYINESWDYPMAGYRRRDEMWREHADYTAGFFYFLAHDPQVPAQLRDEVKRWGLAKDEFIDTDHWPFQLYVREARRLVGDFVMTQHDAQTALTKPDPIGMGSYNMDSHNVQRYVQKDGTAQNEGDTEVPSIPYQISYRVLLPKFSECRNLLVPVCTSASHIGYGTLRLEPVYMIMGEAAGVAAKMAIEQGKDVQKIDTGELTQELRRKGTVMELPDPNTRG